MWRGGIYEREERRFKETSGNIEKVPETGRAQQKRVFGVYGDAVQKANYAVRMYENVGFKTVDENDEEYIMVCEL